MSREEAIDKLTKLQDMLTVRSLFDQTMQEMLEAIEKGKQALQYMIYVEDDRR